MGIADDVDAAGTFVREADGQALGGALVGFIGRFVAPAFSVATALIEDVDGVRTERFAAVVHTGREQDGVVRADDAAVAVVAVETLDLTSLRDGYAALARAKCLRKTPYRPANDAPTGRSR